MLIERKVGNGSTGEGYYGSIKPEDQDLNQRIRAAKELEKRRSRMALLGYVLFLLSVVLPLLFLLLADMFLANQRPSYVGISVLFYGIALIPGMMMMVLGITFGCISIRNARRLEKQRDILLDPPRTAPPTEKPRPRKEKPELMETFDAGSALSSKNK